MRTAWFPYDRNDRSTTIAAIATAWFPYDRNDRSTTITEIEKFLSLRSLRFRVATIAKIAECMFPYARKDRSDRCDRCAAIVAIIWKPGLRVIHLLISPSPKKENKKHKSPIKASKESGRKCFVLFHLGAAKI